MNLFNCFQAVGFYSILPLAIQWMFANQYNVWGYILAVIMFVGFIALSNLVNEGLR